MQYWQCFHVDSELNSPAALIVLLFVYAEVYHLLLRYLVVQAVVCSEMVFGWSLERS